jgi:hypothetical protein
MSTSGASGVSGISGTGRLPPLFRLLVCPYHAPALPSTSSGLRSARQKNRAGLPLCPDLRYSLNIPDAPSQANGFAQRHARSGALTTSQANGSACAKARPLRRLPAGSFPACARLQGIGSVLPKSAFGRIPSLRPKEWRIPVSPHALT